MLYIELPEKIGGFPYPMPKQTTLCFSASNNGQFPDIHPGQTQGLLSDGAGYFPTDFREANQEVPWNIQYL